MFNLNLQSQIKKNSIVKIKNRYNFGWFGDSKM